MNLAVKRQMAKQININPEKITFKGYYNSLSDEDKRTIREAILEVITESHFYSCVRQNKFTKPIQKLITSFTKQEFNWTNEKTN